MVGGAVKGWGFTMEEHRPMAHDDYNQEPNEELVLGPYRNARPSEVKLHTTTSAITQTYVRNDRLILARPMAALPKT